MERMRIALGNGTFVSALLELPASPRACWAFAHGAGAGMEHAFMAALAGQLATHDVATLRYNFPSMERGSPRPDVPAVAHRAVRSAVAGLRERLPRVPVFAGGKSFGGRMTSQAQATRPLDGVRGLVFVGFPLHPTKKPSTDRARHLADVHVPMLFLQGTRDALAEWPLVQSVVDGLGARATLCPIEAADHAFHVPARAGRTDADVIAALAAGVAQWMRTISTAR